MNMDVTDAEVIECRPLADHILQVILKPVDYLPYAAGQYLKLITPDNAALSYSIANAPNASKTYELHIRHGISTSNALLLDTLQHTKRIKLQCPFGGCTLVNLDATKPLFFIASGTGFAPIKAMLETLIPSQRAQPVILYWSARSTAEHYLNQRLQTWDDETPWFKYRPALTKPTSNIIETMMLDDNMTPSQWQVILAGPFASIHALRDELVARDFNSNQLHSDAFGFDIKPS